jgi:hypothetical protein
VLQVSEVAPGRLRAAHVPAALLREDLFGEHAFNGRVLDVQLDGVRAPR